MKYYYVRYQDEKGNTRQTETYIDFAKAFCKYLDILNECRENGEHKRMKNVYRTAKIREIVK